MRNLSGRALVKGFGWVVVCSLGCSIVLTLLLSWTALSEGVLIRSGQIIQFLAVLLGSIAAAKTAGCKGLHHGIVVAAICLVVLLIINLGLWHQEFIWQTWLAKTALLAIAGALGGMIGVGLSAQ